MSYFEATFNRTNNNRYGKLMFGAKLSSEPHSLFLDIFSSFNAKQNMWWLDQAFMSDMVANQAVINIFNSLKLQVQVWNGTEWVTQAYVEPTPYLMEEYLVNLDLFGIEGNEIKVRFLFATSTGIKFDSVSIDFTENLDMTIHEMTLESAIMNGNIDVINKLLNNSEYVSLDYKDGVRLGFSAPELEAGYSRGFGVKTTGYVYAQNAKTDDVLLPEIEGKTFAEIKAIILASGREELINDLEVVENFYNLVLYIGTRGTQEELLSILLNLATML